MTSQTPASQAQANATCSCPAPESDEVSYVAYACGDAEAAAFIEEERAQCVVHGTTSEA